MQIENVIAKYQLVSLVFSQAAVAATQTDAALYPQEVHGAVVNDCVGYTMPFAGHVIGVSAELSAAGSAGTLAIKPTIGGTVVTDPVTTLTTETEKSDTARRETNPFAKNAVIGCKITTSGDWNGTTADLLVCVWVLVTIAGI